MACRSSNHRSSFARGRQAGDDNSLRQAVGAPAAIRSWALRENGLVHRVPPRPGRPSFRRSSLIFPQNERRATKAVSVRRACPAARNRARGLGFAPRPIEAAGPCRWRCLRRRAGGLRLHGRQRPRQDRRRSRRLAEGAGRQGHVLGAARSRFRRRSRRDRLRPGQGRADSAADLSQWPAQPRRPVAAQRRRPRLRRFPPRTTSP